MRMIRKPAASETQPAGSSGDEFSPNTPLPSSDVMNMTVAGPADKALPCSTCVRRLLVVAACPSGGRRSSRSSAKASLSCSRFLVVSEGRNRHE